MILSSLLYLELWRALQSGCLSAAPGHMILLNEILPLRIGKNPDDFYSMFEVVIQLGAILAVVVLFWSQIWPFGRKNNKAPLAKTGVGAWVKTDIFVLWFHILVSTIPAAIIGVLFDDVFERLFYNFQTVAIMLILFGIAFIVIETRHNGKSAKIDSLVDISYTTALMIGIFPAYCSCFSGYITFRSYYCRSSLNWCFKDCCR